MEFDTSSSDALAANESEITRLRADLDRAVALLANHGIGFTRSANPATPWVRPQDNSEAVRYHTEANARIAEEMDELCGPKAFHRNAQRKDALRALSQAAIDMEARMTEKQPRMIDEASMMMLDWMEMGEEPYDDAIARQILGDGESYERFRDRCAEAALQRHPVPHTVPPDDDKDVGC